MRAIVEALAPPHRACGAAVSAILPNGKQEESRGLYAGAARDAIARAGDRRDTARATTVVPFGDESGVQGNIALVAGEPGGPDPAAACSLERIGMLLSATLRRIETTRRLDEALRDRNLLMREIRHRIRNSLQLVINMTPLLLGEAARLDETIADDFEKRITALISIHDMLSWTETKDLVSARTYFWLLADALRRVMSDGVGTLVSLYESEEDPLLPVDRATTIGLVVYELVTNSAKHARGRAVRMDLRVRAEGDALVLRYSDRPAEPRERAGETAGEPEEPYGARGSKIKGQGLGRELVNALLSRARGERSDDGSSLHGFEARFSLP